MICLICEKNINFANTFSENLNSAGELIASFGYGSRHDQFSQIDNPKHRIDDLLNSDVIKAFICDDCFEKKEHCFNGYRSIKTVSLEQTV